MKNILFCVFIGALLKVFGQQHSLNLDQHITNQDWLVVDTVGKNQSADMIVQDSKGNIYAGTNKEALFNTGKQQILKIDTSGQIVWRYYLTAPKSFASFKKILIDKDDNLLLVTIEGEKSCIKKINTNSATEIWTHKASENTDYFDITTDKQGNIYATGWEYSKPNITSTFVEKIAYTGTQTWISRYEINVSDTVFVVLYGNKIEISEVDNSLFIAAFEGGVNQQTVFKYNADGSFAWRNSYQYTTTANMEFTVVDMKIDHENACYLSCSLDTANVSGFRYPYPQDGLLLKLSADGQIEWDKKYIHENKMYMGGLCIDANNNVMLVGSIIQDSLRYGNRNGYVAKITASGNVVWERKLSNSFKTVFTSIYTDSRYFYVMGSAYCCENNNGASMLNFSVDWYLIKLNEYGDIVWWTSENGTAHTRDLPFGMVLSPDKESIYVAGWLEQKYGPYTATVAGIAKYSNHKESLPFEVFFYPNPINQAEEGSLLLNLAESEQVKVVFYNAIGQEVGKLEQYFSEGKHIIPWHFSQTVATGIYFYRLSTVTQSVTGKLILTTK